MSPFSYQMCWTGWMFDADPIRGGWRDVWMICGCCCFTTGCCGWIDLVGAAVVVGLRLARGGQSMGSSSKKLLTCAWAAGNPICGCWLGRSHGGDMAMSSGANGTRLPPELLLLAQLGARLSTSSRLQPSSALTSNIIAIAIPIFDEFNSL